MRQKIFFMVALMMFGDVYLIGPTAAHDPPAQTAVFYVQ